MEAPGGVEAPRRACASGGGRSRLRLRLRRRPPFISLPTTKRASTNGFATVWWPRFPASAGIAGDLSSSVKSSSTSAATRSSSGSTRNARANGGESRKPRRAGRWGSG